MPEALLRSRGVRPTLLRRETLALLLEAGSPLSLKALSGRFTGKQPDRVSLYRTLNLLESCGLVHKALGADGAWRYCAHSSEGEGCPGNHAHFLCLKCGEMICLKDQPIPNLELPEGFVVHGKQLVAYGLCLRCAAGRVSGSEEEDASAPPPEGPGRAGDEQGSPRRPSRRGSR